MEKIFNKLIGNIKDIYYETISDVKVKAALLTFVSGFFIHLFSLVNILHNYDDITYFGTRYGTGMESGRWALTYIGDIFGKIWGWPNASYLHGIVFIFLIAVSAWFIMDIFRIKKLSIGLLIGLVLVTFPSTVSTLFFKYTAVYYGLAILLSVGAVWILEKSRFGWFFSIWCIAVALGIYQAYLPLTISLMIVLLMFKIIKEGKNFADILKIGLYYCVILIGGVILYFGILKLSLYVFNTELLDYQGVSDMGNISIASIFPMIIKAVKECLNMPFNNYCNLAPNNILKIGYILLFVISFALMIFTVFINNREAYIGRMLMLLLLLVCFPLAVNFIVIMCPNSWIYTLMVFSFVVLLLLPVILYECVDEKWKLGNILRKSALVIVIVMMCNYAYIANVNYQTMYFTDRQTENYFSSMLTQVRMTDGYKSSMPWAFIGNNITDPSFKNFAANNLMYGGNGAEYVNAYSRISWFRAYQGFDIKLVADIEKAILYKNEDVKNMPCYPDNGSIKIIDGIVVIKLENVI